MRGHCRQLRVDISSVRGRFLLAPPALTAWAVMIRLDAATVLLQWAVGGLLFLWVTTRRREVGIGYGWLLRGVYLVLAVGALAAGRLVGSGVLVRDVASALVAVAAGVALVVSVVRRRAGVAGERERVSARSARVEAMTGIAREADGPLDGVPEFPQIGRASCRERV